MHHDGDDDDDDDDMCILWWCVFLCPAKNHRFMSFKICYNMFPKLFDNVMNVQKIFFFMAMVMMMLVVGGNVWLLNVGGLQHQHQEQLTKLRWSRSRGGTALRQGSFFSKWPHPLFSVNFNEPLFFCFLRMIATVLGFCMCLSPLLQIYLGNIEAGRGVELKMACF